MLRSLRNISADVALRDVVLQDIRADAGAWTTGLGQLCLMRRSDAAQTPAVQMLKQLPVTVVLLVGDWGQMEYPPATDGDHPVTWIVVKQKELDGYWSKLGIPEVQFQIVNGPLQHVATFLWTWENRSIKLL